MSTILRFKGANDEVVSVGRTVGLFGDEYSHVELPSPTPPMPKCKPPRSRTKMLEKLLDFTQKGIEKNEAMGADFYSKGKQVAYEEMWEHIAKILRKECDE
jgi:hypothetical protein